MASVAALTDPFTGANNAPAYPTGSIIDSNAGEVIPFFNTGDHQDGAAVSTASLDVNCAAGQTSTNRADVATALGLIWQDVFFKVVTLPGSNTTIWNWYNNTTLIGGIQVRPAATTTYNLAIRSASTSVFTTTTPLNVDEWYRLAWKVVPGSSTGLRLKIFGGANLLTMTPTTDSDDKASGVSAAGIDNIRFGILGTDAARGAMRVRFDQLRTDDAAQPTLGGTSTVISALQETFENGTNGAAIAVSPVTFFSSLLTGSTAANLQFTNNIPYANSFAMRVHPTAAVAGGRIDFATQTTIHWKFRIKIDTPPGGNVAIINFYNEVGATSTKIGDVQMTSDRRLRLRDNNTERFLSSPLTAGVYHEVYMKIKPNDPTGLRMKIYSGTARGTNVPSQDSLDQASSVAVAGTNLMRIGCITAETLDYTVDAFFADTTTEPPGISPPGGSITLQQPENIIDVEPYDTRAISFLVSGGTAPYTFTVTPQGDAPALTGTGANRTFTAPAVFAGTTYVYSVEAKDSFNNTDTKTFSITVLPQNLFTFGTGSAWFPYQERLRSVDELSWVS